MIDVTNWKDVTTWKWPDFTPEEMACKGDQSLKVDEGFMDTLQKIRSVVGFPMIVSSGYRSPAYNAKVSTTGENGPHTTGRAVDIFVSGWKAVKVIRAALELGITGLGISQMGPHEKRFVHLDSCENGPDCPRPTVWNYP